MTNHLEEYLQDAAPPLEDDYRNLQRIALGEVIKLSAETVRPAQNQIELAYRTARSIAEKRLEEAGKKIEENFQQRRSAAQRQYQEQMAQIQAQYESDLDNLDSKTKSKRDHITGIADAHVQDARKHCEYEVMLAENVADGAVLKCRQERQNMKVAVPAAQKRLENLREQADMVLRRYRQPIPSWPEDGVPDSGDKDDHDVTFRKQQELAEQSLDMLGSLRTPRLFMGLRPFVLTVVWCGAAVGLMWLLHQLKLPHLPSLFITAPAAGGVMLIITLIAGKILWRRGRSQAMAVYQQFQQALAAALAVLEKRQKLALEQIEQRIQEANEKRDAEVRKVREQFDSAKAERKKRREASLQQIDESYQQARQQLDERQDRQRQQTDQEYQNIQQNLQQQYDRELQELQKLTGQEQAEFQQRYDSECRLLEKRWQEGLSGIETLLHKTAQLDRTLLIDWDDAYWRQYQPARTFSSIVRFGHFRLNLGQLADSVLEQAKFKPDRTAPILLPALLAFPDRCCLLLQTQRRGREHAIETLRSVMTRLFTSLPAGRVHFIIIDPVGLGENFAGFMHAADYEEALVGGRIWTDPAQIQQRLVDLTDHMENVIQKYLRNEFETIEEYNQQAGELAEPYRFLVIADFPANFNEEAARRLGSIINSGARCGVYTLIAYDARQEAPAGIDIEDLAANSVHLLYENNGFVWQDNIFRQFPLALDTSPAEELLTNLMHTVGKAAQDSTRVEVPFEIIAPADERYWTLESSKEINVPIGRTGATRLQHLRLGRGVAQHLLIAGKTGSGKSTLLHVIITNLSLWYAPDEVELYLIDFKRGVEFKTYVTHKLAHARTVAIESDREFGLSILQRLDGEMARRGDLFRRAGVQDIASYRQVSGLVLPRTILIVDEFQVFFIEDDKLSQDAALLLEQLVRQGRAFGIHVLLGSQTLGGTSGLARSTIGQMAVRIALQCSEADSQLILDDDNVAARLLSRPGEAIYNDASGMVIGNSPFQTAWLPDFIRDKYLAHIAELNAARTGPHEPIIVFEGNVPADITGNRRLAECLEPSPPAPGVTAPQAWLGEPVAIKEPTRVVFRRQSGANLLIIGQRELEALGVMSAATISLAAQHEAQSARFVIMDGSPADSPHAGQWERIASVLPHNHRNVEWREVCDVIGELAGEVQRRHQNDHLEAEAIYVLIYGLQRYRVLRRSEDEFGFSMEQEAAPRPDKQLVEIIRDGPAVGIHVLVWADTLAAVERALDRQTIREFDNRVLFQMSASDSSSLIDSPIANQLGFHRALFYSEEMGVLEKFRPYAPAGAEWLEGLKTQLARKTAHD